MRLLSLGVGLVLLAGCGRASIKTYHRPQTAWDTIRKVALLPVETPSENQIRREQLTQLFATELRKEAGLEEVIDVSSDSPLGLFPSAEEVGKRYTVDGVFSLSVDDTDGLSIQVKLHDALTGELIWTDSYLAGGGAEIYSSKTAQQRIQRAFHRIANDFSKIRASSSR